MLEKQIYPDLKDEKGNPIPPYDVTAHTLSLLMNVKFTTVNKPFTYRIPSEYFGKNSDNDYAVAHPPRYAVYKSNIPKWMKVGLAGLLKKAGVNRNNSAI